MSAKSPKLLLVEGDVGLQEQIRWSLDGYEVLTATDREGALNQLRRFEPPVALLDLGLPPDPGGATEGLVALQQILAMAPSTKVIVITGNQHQANAIKAIGVGAFDFHRKPFAEQTVEIIIDRAYRVYELEQQNGPTPCAAAASSCKAAHGRSQPEGPFAQQRQRGPGRRAVGDQPAHALWADEPVGLEIVTFLTP